MARYSHDLGSRFISVGGAIAAGLPNVNAGTTPKNNGTGTGPGDEIGITIDRQALLHSGYSWDCVVSGGTLSALAANLEGSEDGVNWFTVDQSGAAGGISATGGLQHVTNKPVRYLRVNVTTFTSSGGSPVAQFGISL